MKFYVHTNEHNDLEYSLSLRMRLYVMCVCAQTNDELKIVKLIEWQQRRSIIPLKYVTNLHTNKIANSHSIW